MKKIKITPIKRTLKARGGTSHHGDHIIASKDELVILFNAEPNIIRKHNHPLYPAGTQFGFCFYTQFRDVVTGIILFDHAQYFPIKGTEWIQWKINASSKALSKEARQYLEQLLYALRKSIKVPKTYKRYDYSDADNKPDVINMGKSQDNRKGKDKRAKVKTSSRT